MSFSEEEIFASADYFRNWQCSLCEWWIEVSSGFIAQDDRWKPLFIQQKEQRINRIKCLLKGSGLTLEQKYKINFQLCNEYKKFVVDSAIHYVDQNLEIARKLNNRDLKNQSFLQLSLLYSMCGRYRDAELILEEIKTSELSKDLLSVYYETYSRFWEYYSITANSRYGKQRAVYQIHYYLFWIKLLLIINYPGHIIMEGAIP